MVIYLGNEMGPRSAIKRNQGTNVAHRCLTARFDLNEKNQCKRPEHFNGTHREHENRFQFLKLLSRGSERSTVPKLTPFFRWLARQPDSTVPSKPFTHVVRDLHVEGALEKLERIDRLKLAGNPRQERRTGE
jgi:hypothetical protein